MRLMAVVMMGRVTRQVATSEERRALRPLSVVRCSQHRQRTRHRRDHGRSALIPEFSRALDDSLHLGDSLVHGTSL
jgi:hypothetical protein